MASGLSLRKRGVGRKIGSIVHHLQDEGRLLKKVDASEEVRQTYHDSLLFGRIPVTMIIRAELNSGWAGFVWRVVDILCVLTSVSIFVYRSYDPLNTSVEEWARICQLAFSSFFVVDYIGRIYSAPSRVQYISSWEGIIDFLSIWPAVTTRISGSKGSILQLLVFLRILRLIPLMRKTLIIRSAVLKHTMLIGFTLLVILFIGAGVFQFVEYHATSPAVLAEYDCTAPYGCWDFWESYYFMVVTTATVGYGDVVPRSAPGHIVAVVAIIFALSYIPLQISKIISLVTSKPYGEAVSLASVVSTKYIILSGLSCVDTLEELLSAFFSPLHAQKITSSPVKVVIVGTSKPSFRVKSLLGQYGVERVAYVQGDLEMPEDFQRAAGRYATAVYLLANRHNPDPLAEDRAQMIKAMMAQHACGRGVRVLVETLQPQPGWSLRPLGAEESAGGGTNTDLICPAPTRMHLLAQSCCTPGITTLIPNLFRTSPPAARPGRGCDWLDQYLHGQRMEVYPLLLLEALHGLLYEEVAEILYRSFHVILIAVDIATSPLASSPSSASPTSEPSRVAQEQGWMNQALGREGSSSAINPTPPAPSLLPVERTNEASKAESSSPNDEAPSLPTSTARSASGARAPGKPKLEHMATFRGADSLYGTKKCKIPKAERRLLLRPTGHVVGPQDVGLVVAPDLKTVEQITASLVSVQEKRDMVAWANITADFRELQETLVQLAQGQAPGTERGSPTTDGGMNKGSLGMSRAETVPGGNGGAAATWTTAVAMPLEPLHGVIQEGSWKQPGTGGGGGPTGRESSSQGVLGTESLACLEEGALRRSVGRPGTGGIAGTGKGSLGGVKGDEWIVEKCCDELIGEVMREWRSKKASWRVESIVESGVAEEREVFKGWMEKEHDSGSHDDSNDVKMKGGDLHEIRRTGGGGGDSGTGGTGTEGETGAQGEDCGAGGGTGGARSGGGEGEEDAEAGGGTRRAKPVEAAPRPGLGEAGDEEWEAAGGMLKGETVREEGAWLLDWPPPPGTFYECIPPTVIGRRIDEIEASLRERTLKVAMLRPHILVALHDRCWPNSFQHFFASLRGYAAGAHERATGLMGDPDALRGRAPGAGGAAAGRGSSAAAAAGQAGLAWGHMAGGGSVKRRANKDKGAFCVSAAPVLILRKAPPSVEEWATVGYFPDVFFMCGSPSYELDLVRAGVTNALRVVLLTSEIWHGVALNEEEEGNAPSNITDNPAFFDADTCNVMVAASIDRLLQCSRQEDLAADGTHATDLNECLSLAHSWSDNLPKMICRLYNTPKSAVAQSDAAGGLPEALAAVGGPYCHADTLSRVICELQNELSFRYLRPEGDRVKLMAKGATYKRDPEAVTRTVPPFCEGRAFSPRSLLFLSYGVLYNRNLQQLVDQLLHGAPALNDLANNTDAKVKLRLRLVPPACIGAPFSSMFLWVLREARQLVIALYRPVGTCGSLRPYVLTNPPAETILVEGDMMYVIQSVM